MTGTDHEREHGGMDERQAELSRGSRWDFSDLRALYLNCTLKRSPDVSHTQGLADRSIAILEANGVTVETIRIVDHQVATGVYPDMTEHGWAADDWPSISEKVMASDILVLCTPIWLGEKSSVCTQVIERLYGNSHILNDEGQYAYYGRVGGCLVTGNEDGVKHCAMNVLYSLQHLGYTIPPQADAGWIGEAGPGPSYLDPGSGGPENDFTNRNTAFMTWNLLHAARMLKDAGGIPAYGNQRSAWTRDAGSTIRIPTTASSRQRISARPTVALVRSWDGDARRLNHAKPRCVLSSGRRSRIDSSFSRADRSPVRPGGSRPCARSARGGASCSVRGGGPARGRRPPMPTSCSGICRRRPTSPASMRAEERLFADLPAPFRDALARFDPHGDALVLAPPFSAVYEIAGRPALRRSPARVGRARGQDRRRRVARRGRDPDAELRGRRGRCRHPDGRRGAASMRARAPYGPATRATASTAVAPTCAGSSPVPPPMPRKRPRT